MALRPARSAPSHRSRQPPGPCHLLFQDLLTFRGSLWPSLRGQLPTPHHPDTLAASGVHVSGLSAARLCWGRVSAQCSGRCWFPAADLSG